MHVCVLPCATQCADDMSLQGCHVACKASFHGNILSFLWQKCTNVSDWHILNPPACNWEATNWSMFTLVWVRVEGVCVQMPQISEELGWFLRASKQRWDIASMYVYLLSCCPHAEFNCAARERCRTQILWVGYPRFTHVTWERKRETESEEDNASVYNIDCIGRKKKWNDTEERKTWKMRAEERRAGCW